MQPDVAFLASTDITYPVTISIASEWVGAGLAQDAFVNKNDPAMARPTGYLRAGTTKTSADIARVYVRFVVTEPLALATIHNADFMVWNYRSGSSDGSNCGLEVESGIVVRKLTSTWDATTLTWNNQPGYTTSGQVGNRAAYSDTPTTCSGPGELLYSIEDIVQSWADGEQDYGLVMMAPSESAVINWRQYRSKETGTADRQDDHMPILFIDYTPPESLQVAYMVEHGSTVEDSYEADLAQVAAGNSGDTPPVVRALTAEEAREEARTSGVTYRSDLMAQTHPDGLTDEEIEDSYADDGNDTPPTSTPTPRPTPTATGFPNAILNQNPYFESTVEPWSVEGGALTQSTALAHEVQGSALVVTNEGVSETAIRSESAIPVTATEFYIASGWFRPVGTGTSIRYGIDWFDSAGNVIGSDLASRDLEADTWTQEETAYWPPANAVTAQLRAVITPPVAQASLHMDELLLLGPAPKTTPSPEPTTSPSPSPSPSDTVTPTPTPSPTPTPTASSVALNSNPSFESGVSPWYSWWEGDELTQSTEQAYEGSASAKLGGPGCCTAIAQDLSVTEGTYQLTGWVRPEADATGWYGVDWYDADWNFLDSSAGHSELSTGLWQPLETVVVTAPAGTANAVLWAEADVLIEESSQTVYLDDLRMTSVAGAASRKATASGPKREVPKLVKELREKISARSKQGKAQASASGYMGTANIIPSDKSWPENITSWSECTNNPEWAKSVRGWLKNRFNWCQIVDVVAHQWVKRGPVKKKIGDAFLTYYVRVETELNRREFTIYQKFQPGFSLGTLFDAQFEWDLAYDSDSGDAVRTCAPAEGYGVLKRPLYSWGLGYDGHDWDASVRFKSTHLAAPNGIEQCSIQPYVKVTSSTGTRKMARKGSEIFVRCDKSAAIKFGYNKLGGGCVTLMGMPSLDLGRNDTNQHGETWPEQFDHLYKALIFHNGAYPVPGGSNFPGLPPLTVKNLPGLTSEHPLSRMTNGDKRDEQQEESSRICRTEISKTWPGSIKLYGDKALNCDEFPFASTYQGSLNANPSYNFSVRLINARQNQRFGNSLKAWYYNNRIIDGDMFTIGFTSM
ncbi:DNRLRE domain-containing protein [Microtetraspora sp. AC03309]|uniref:DNRLRE domain-containing protein n=1 Tax=Microtetraspora sp. AC03309 TaxID=2779376 RepID=UPI001E5CFA6B|nr:DNRLRE domain-containing protein [Microtetraspora sp. AC03309]MCC5575436.1 DNRLRE domain-containing protein [Microtetraspora sp. AC03309]